MGAPDEQVSQEPAEGKTGTLSNQRATMIDAQVDACVSACADVIAAQRTEIEQRFDDQLAQLQAQKDAVLAVMDTAAEEWPAAVEAEKRDTLTREALSDDES